jgi:hypothetical protein
MKLNPNSKSPQRSQTTGLIWGGIAYTYLDGSISSDSQGYFLFCFLSCFTHWLFNTLEGNLIPRYLKVYYLERTQPAVNSILKAIFHICMCSYLFVAIRTYGDAIQSSFPTLLARWALQWISSKSLIDDESLLITWV